MSLAGKRVLVTRAAGQAGDLARELEARGASVVVVPVLEIADPESWAPLDAAIRALSSYRAVVFTSVNAVEKLFARIHQVVGTCDVAALPAEIGAFAVGPRTAEALSRMGIEPAAVPDEFRGEALAEPIARVLGSVAGARILLPRAAAGREELPAALRRAGARVDVVPAYRTLVPEGASRTLRDALAVRVDAVTFASPSAVSHTVEILGGADAARRALAGAMLAAIGPTTAARVEELGLGAPVVAAKATAGALADAVARAHRSSRA